MTKEFDCFRRGGDIVYNLQLAVEWLGKPDAYKNKYGEVENAAINEADASNSLYKAREMGCITHEQWMELHDMLPNIRPDIIDNYSETNEAWVSLDTLIRKIAINI